MIQETTYPHRLSGGAEVNINFYWDVQVPDGASDEVLSVCAVQLLGALIDDGNQKFDVSNECAMRMLGEDFDSLADFARAAWENQHVEYQMAAMEQTVSAAFTYRRSC